MDGTEKKVSSAQVVIVGGGIIGTAAARELSRYKLDVLLLEKEPEVGWGTTKANSGIVHGGFHEEEGTLKAKYCFRQPDVPQALRRAERLFCAKRDFDGWPYPGGDGNSQAVL